MVVFVFKALPCNKLFHMQFYKSSIFRSKIETFNTMQIFTNKSTGATNKIYVKPDKKLKPVLLKLWHLKGASFQQHCSPEVLFPQGSLGKAHNPGDLISSYSPERHRVCVWGGGFVAFCHQEKHNYLL